MSDNEISAEILAELQTALDFEAAAVEAAETVQAKYNVLAGELAELRERLDQQANLVGICDRAVLAANERLTRLLRANGVVRTAGGFALAEPAAAPEIDADRGYQQPNAQVTQWGPQGGFRVAEIDAEVTPC